MAMLRVVKGRYLCGHVAWCEGKLFVWPCCSCIACTPKQEMSDKLYIKNKSTVGTDKAVLYESQQTVGLTPAWCRAPQYCIDPWSVSGRAYSRKS